MKQESSRRYGLLTMITMVAGILIGSGIYVKNDQLYEITASTLISLFAWIFVGIMVIAMIVNFIEITSSTTIKGEAGTLSAWGTKFIGPKTGKIFGVFIVYLYFPVINTVLALYGAEYILSMFADAGLFYQYGAELGNHSAVMEWTTFLIITGVGSGFLFLSYMMNSISHKGGKIVQVAGTAIKVIPLFFIVIVVTLFMIPGIGESLPGITDPPTNDIAGKDKNPFVLLLFAAPAVMFAFAGFIQPAALSAEAKDKKTFKRGLVIGTVFTTIIYILFSAAMLSTGAVGPDGEYTFRMTNVIQSLFPVHYIWIAPLMSSMVVISIISSLSGHTIVAIRANSSMSETNIVPDVNGNMISRNKQGVPQKSGMFVMLITFAWLILFRSIDAIAVHSQLTHVAASSSESALRIGHFYSLNYASNLTPLIDFAIYGTLIGAAWWNRKTGNVEVEKQKGYGIAAFISITMVIMVLVAQVAFVLDSAIGSSKDVPTFVAMIPLTTVIIMSIAFTVAYLVISAQTKKTTNAQWKSKKEYIKAYQLVLTLEEYRAMVKTNNKTKAKKKKVIPKKKPISKKPKEKKASVKKK